MLDRTQARSLMSADDLDDAEVDVILRALYGVAEVCYEHYCATMREEGEVHEADKAQ